MERRERGGGKVRKGEVKTVYWRPHEGREPQEKRCMESPCGRLWHRQSRHLSHPLGHRYGSGTSVGGGTPCVSLCMCRACCSVPLPPERERGREREEEKEGDTGRECVCVCVCVCAWGGGEQH